MVAESVHGLRPPLHVLTLFLKPGTREYFLEALARDWPEMLHPYEDLYAGRAYLPSSETKPVDLVLREMKADWPIVGRRPSLSNG